MTRATEACVRLAQTRAAVRLAIRDLEQPAMPVHPAPSTGWMQSLWRRLKETPATRTVVQGVDDWANHSALPGIAVMAADAANAALRPIAQRTPLRLVLVAAAVGGMLAWSRPWRRIVTPALMAAVLPRLVSQILQRGPRPPWMTLLAALADRKPATTRVP